MNRKKLEYILGVVEDSELFTNCVEEDANPAELVEALGFGELLPLGEKLEVLREVVALVEVEQFKLKHRLRVSREVLG
ncbi:MAG: hypothetical protein HN742_11140 [Lentisphaerae bacterium]|jgi:hypothetical protein|nr:hypothetical protein [Lentisphaerota bacterium]MBT5610508.1 hypothetical protein [Lentisphaerota bacterium]MBT7056063.1 hypothetical protein [Lentisphaerota bacterium]MBT7842420.1 hypothetical protein [Lentisphaerota bacterium]